MTSCCYGITIATGYQPLWLTSVGVVVLFGAAREEIGFHIRMHLAPGDLYKINALCILLQCSAIVFLALW